MSKNLMRGYPDGAEITILETYYSFPKKNYETGESEDDFLIITFIYTCDGAPRHGHSIIKNPKYTFYKIKDGGVVPDHPLFFIEKDKVEPVTVPYKNLEREVAKATDKLDIYKENIKDFNRKENKKLLTDPSIFWSDVNIEDHYRYKFSRAYTNDIPELRKAFFDIEVDTRYMSGDFVESGECPINMISFHDEYHNRTRSYILRNPRNPLIEQFENDYNKGVFGEEQIKEFVKENVGGWKQEYRFGLNDTKYELLFFDDELDMLVTFFHNVHEADPDFIEGWNCSAFDLQYIIDRIVTLNADPTDIMCNPKFEKLVVRNYVDQKNLNDFAERGDYTFISGYPVWVDQMIQYASRRKAKIGSFKSFKLDDIGKDVAGVKKLDYSHITNNITDLPYLDFKTFVLYNIMDVVVQKCIENRSQDIEYMFSKAIANCTSYRKVHRQSIFLINRMASDFEKQDFIIGTNHNKWNKPSDEKFQGALVGDPMKTNDFSKVKIGNRAIMVSDNCMDFDAKSMYPSIIIQNNIAPNTQIGKIEIPGKVYDNENAYHNEKYNRSGEFIENMMTDNPIEFGKRWFGLAGVSEFLNDMKEYASSHYKYGSPYSRFKVENGKVIENPLYDIKKDDHKEINNNRPIYKLSKLEDSGISNDYNTIMEGKTNNGDSKPD